MHCGGKFLLGPGLRRLIPALAALVLVAVPPRLPGAAPEQTARARVELERLARELSLPFRPELAELTGDHARGSTFMDLDGTRHVLVNPSFVDQPLALQLTLIHELQHFEDLKILDEDGLLTPGDPVGRRGYRSALRAHLEMRAYARQLAALKELRRRGGLTPAERASAVTLAQEYEENHSASEGLRQIFMDPARHSFTLSPRQLALAPGTGASVDFRRNYLYPETLIFRLTVVDDPAGILADLPARGLFRDIHGRADFRVDIAKSGGPAWPIWTRIYRVASEDLARAASEELERTPPDSASAPELERYGESWLTGARERTVRPTLVLEEPGRIGEVEPGQEVTVLTRFALLGFAGQDESVKVRWETRGAEGGEPVSRDELFRFAFPAEKIDPAEDLTKTGVGTFSFKVDPQRFAPGGSYRVHVSFGELDRRLTIPFTVRAPRDASSRPSGASGGERPGEAGSRPAHVFFVIRVEGRGYVPHWDGASFVLEGASEELFRLDRGQDLAAQLRSYHDRLLGDPCRARIPGMPGAYKRPMIWNAGPRISVVDGPILGGRELDAIKLTDTWKQVGRDGPNLHELVKKVGCR